MKLLVLCYCYYSFLLSEIYFLFFILLLFFLNIHLVILTELTAKMRGYSSFEVVFSRVFPEYGLTSYLR